MLLMSSLRKAVRGGRLVTENRFQPEVARTTHERVTALPWNEQTNNEVVSFN